MRDRFFALMGALLFLVTSSALTIAVIWQNTHPAKTESQQATPPVDQNALPPEAAAQQNGLKGTKLRDFTPVKSVTSLQTIDIKPGTGAEAKAGDTLSVDYTGAVAATGVVFESSIDSGQPATLSLNGVIEGWQKGIPGMKEGGTRRLLIPAKQAYGANPPAGSGIPANADLVFDVTLQKVGP